MELNDYNYEDIGVGKVFEFKRILTKKNVDEFADLTEDHNPLHTDEEYAKTTQFKGRIMHGMLAASLFSTLFGMECPGKKNLYLSQSLNFKKPIPPDSELTVRGTVKQKMDSFKMITIFTEIILNNEVMIDGEARVKII
ncbi:MaoC family dehydratase [Candidatus Woesearchaeota archaeon]|nr:MaoC family dehydratase [Candidatus Woesearchaeota archaeon]